MVVAVSTQPTGPLTDASAPTLLRRAIFLNYYKLFKWPALAAIHVADTARALEALTDAEVIEEGLGVLRAQFGASSVPTPIQSNVTRWAADSFSLGAYSFFAIGNPKNITGGHGREWGLLQGR